MITPAPLIILLHETFEGNAPDTVVRMILANPLVVIGKTHDIILKVTGDLAAI